MNVAIWVLIVVFVGSAGLGALALWAWLRGLIRQAQADRAQRLANAGQEVARIEQGAIAERENQLQQLEQEAETELTGERNALSEDEAVIAERVDVQALRERDLAVLKGEVRAKERAAAALREEARRMTTDREMLLLQQEEKLEQVSELTRSQVIQNIVDERVAKARHQGQIRFRTVEEQSQDEAASNSERVMATVVNRYDGTGHLDRVQNAINVSDTRTLQTLADEAGPVHRVFAETIGCELLCDEAAKTVTVRGDDPLAREVARRVLRQVANRSIRSAERISAITDQVRGELDREVYNAGKKTVRSLGLKPVDPEIVRLVGRLKFRLSYSQNQLKHAIEVAHISGMLAVELGLDSRLARRGGLLHDIGKAMTHDHEGSHAVLGAEMARRHGEDEVVCNAIGGHHNDERPATAVAHIVAAADALSGARPGARRESITQYISRIQDIQDIASRPAAVRRVDVMHAGREVRVIVAGEERGAIDEPENRGAIILSDGELHPLAEEIARNLEENVPFAGQIRVTVIRESRAVAMAT